MTLEPRTDREPPFRPLANLPGEYDVGSIIRAAVDHDPEKMRFYLTCSVGELAQRIADALPARTEPETRELAKRSLEDAVIANYQHSTPATRLKLEEAWANLRAALTQEMP